MKSQDKHCTVRMILSAKVAFLKTLCFLRRSTRYVATYTVVISVSTVDFLHSSQLPPLSFNHIEHTCVQASCPNLRNGLFLLRRLTLLFPALQLIATFVHLLILREHVNRLIEVSVRHRRVDPQAAAFEIKA